MTRYIVATSLTGTFLAVRYLEEEAGRIETGDVVGEFKDERTARDFCQTWYGQTAGGT